MPTRGLLARAHGARGGIAYWRGDFATTGTFYQRALEEARRSGDRRVLADALYNAGYTPFAAAPDPESMYRFSGPYFEEAAALYRELGDQRGLASVEWGLGTGATYVHHWDDATEHMERALERLSRGRRRSVRRGLGAPHGRTHPDASGRSRDRRPAVP